MNVVKDITVAGQTIFVKVSDKRKKKAPGEKRSEREKATPEQIQKINQKNAERILAILINYNFRPGDYHIVLTYSNEAPFKAQAKKDLEKFKRQITDRYRTDGLNLRWITATEYEHTRIHHHIVCSAGVDLCEIEKIWGHGFIRPTYLDDSGDYRKLAAYLIKETSKTFRDSDAVSRRRYNCSRSIIRPMTNEDDKVSAAQLIEPRPIEGYYVDQDSVYRGRNPITGKQYIEYVMISMTEEPRLKVWNRGKRKKLRSEYFRVGKNHQIEMDFEAMLAG